MSLKEVLHTEQVSHLDLSSFCQAASGTPVRDVVALMREKGVNVCLVTQDNHLIGILTDRDVLRKVVTAPQTWSWPVDTVMTSSPITISPDAPAAEALWLMDERHFRNLPAVDSSGAIVGNMTHQAIINYLAARYPIEILNLPPRPDQIPEKVEGG